MYGSQNLHKLYPEYSLITKYLLPSINLLNITEKTLRLHGFVNAWVEKDMLLLIFQPGKVFMNGWWRFENLYKKCPNYIETIDIDIGVIGVYFGIIDKWKGIEKLVIKGKYSWINRDFPLYCENFLVKDHYGKIEKEYAQYRVIKRDKEYQKWKENELGLWEGAMDKQEYELPPIEIEFKYEK